MSNIDPTESVRREATEEINAKKADRARLEAEHGQVWDTAELRRDFSVVGFDAPCIVVERKSDEMRGSMFFQNSPRFYWGFEKV